MGHLTGITDVRDHKDRMDGGTGEQTAAAVDWSIYR
jgi:hypothetical protein